MDASRILTSLAGSTCTNFRLVAGGSLILYLHSVESSSGPDWILHIEPAWRFDHNSQPLMGSFDTPDDDNVEQWLSKLEKLRGREIQDIRTRNPVLDLVIRFADGYSILTFAHSVEDGENWELRSKDGRRLGMASGDICYLKGLF